MQTTPTLSSSPAACSPGTDLASKEMQRRVNALRQIDNWTNWFYLVREVALVALVVALAIAFYEYRADWGLEWAWNVPVTLVAIVLVGAGQHRLTTLAHEASHYMLFRNRTLNELIADWFCMYSMWSTTHGYRLQHLAHHQFVNDPERDPDVTQMTASGHRFQFPMSRAQFVWRCVLKQLLWLPGLVRYIRARAQYATTGSGKGPYRVSGGSGRYGLIVMITYLLALLASLIGLYQVGNLWLLALVPVGLWVPAMGAFLLAPERVYRQNAVRCDITPRWSMVGRVTHVTLVFVALTWLTYWTGAPWALYYVLLWMVPIGTTFAFFMVLRQVVQHGNADQERLTNTRIFHVGRLIQLAVFPLGMDWHLPHHLFPMVPHYRLKELHELLLETDDYREHATLVEGYFFHERPPVHPTVLDLMTRSPD